MAKDIGSKAIDIGEGNLLRVTHFEGQTHSIELTTEKTTGVSAVGARILIPASAFDELIRAFKLSAYIAKECRPAETSENA